MGGWGSGLGGAGSDFGLGLSFDDFGANLETRDVAFIGASSKSSKSITTKLFSKKNKTKGGGELSCCFPAEAVGRDGDGG